MMNCRWARCAMARVRRCPPPPARPPADARACGRRTALGAQCTKRIVKYTSPNHYGGMPLLHPTSRHTTTSTCTSLLGSRHTVHPFTRNKARAFNRQSSSPHPASDGLRKPAHAHAASPAHPVKREYLNSPSPCDETILTCAAYMEMALREMQKQKGWGRYGVISPPCSRGTSPR